MGYFSQVLKGAGWMGGLRASTRVFSYIKVAILARLLTPRQFGLFGIASILLALLETVTETGINVFFLQGEGKIKDYLDTAWVVSILRGIAISLLIIISAPFVATFFNSPESLTLIYFTSLVSFIRGFINPAIISLRKELKFRKEFLIYLTVFSIDALAAIIYAFYTKTAASLVLGMSVSAVAEVVLSFVVIPERPAFRFNAAKAKKIVKRGKYVTIAQSTSLAYNQGDDIFVGRLLNTQALGLYQIAYKFSTLPLTEIAEVLHKVTFPVYVKIVGDLKRLKNAYFKVALSTFVLVFPVGILLYLFPENIILFFLGNQWLEAADLLRILALFGVMRALIFTSNSLFLSLKKQEYVALGNTLSFLGMAISAYPFITRFGLIGAAYSAITGLVISIPITTILLIKTLRNG